MPGTSAIITACRRQELNLLQVFDEAPMLGNRIKGDHLSIISSTNMAHLPPDSYYIFSEVDNKFVNLCNTDPSLVREPLVVGNEQVLVSILLLGRPSAITTSGTNSSGSSQRVIRQTISTRSGPKTMLGTCAVTMFMSSEPWTGRRHRGGGSPISQVSTHTSKQMLVIIADPGKV